MGETFIIETMEDLQNVLDNNIEELEEYADTLEII